MLLERDRLVQKIREKTWTNASPSAQEMDIHWSYPSKKRDKWHWIRASAPDLAAKTRVLPCSRGNVMDPDADLRHVSPRFVLPKPLQPIIGPEAHHYSFDDD